MFENLQLNTCMFDSYHWIFCSTVWGNIKSVSHVKLNMGGFCLKLDWTHFTVCVKGYSLEGSAPNHWKNSNRFILCSL